MPRARQPTRRVPPDEATGPDDYDGAWKAMSDRFFRPLLQLCHPKAHDDIDWSQDVENLDKDLKKLQPKAMSSDRWADKLVRVQRRPSVELDEGQQFFPGDTGLVYLHTEFQNQRDGELPLRMFTTSYRAFDRYQCPVTSLVILGDKGIWNPGDWFGWSFWDTRVKIEFPVIKLWKYNEPEQWTKLEELAKENPFAILIMAHLKSKATQNRASQRYRWKRQLFQRLLESRYSRADIEALLDYVDWLMQLPEPFEMQLNEEIAKMETTKERVPYMTPWERRGLERGLKRGRREGEREGRQEGRRLGKAETLKDMLSQRFGDLAEGVLERIDRADVDLLDLWLGRLFDTKNLDDVFEPSACDLPDPPSPSAP